VVSASAKLARAQRGRFSFDLSGVQKLLTGFIRVAFECSNAGGVPRALIGGILDSRRIYD